MSSSHSMYTRCIGGDDEGLKSREREESHGGPDFLLNVPRFAADLRACRPTSLPNCPDIT